MADKRRFDLFADFLVRRFPEARRVFDVAGGQGMLNEALVARSRECVTFDRRHKHLDVAFQEREFTLEEPCSADLVVGMHADGATRIIIEYAARHGIPCAVVPCCSDNSMPYKPWMRHLDELARHLGLRTEEALLPMVGRARVLVGVPDAHLSSKS
jgi:hypothetical protein